MMKINAYLAGKTRHELENELAACRDHLRQRREDRFPPDAEEEAAFARSITDYEDALKRVRDGGDAR